MQRLCPLQTTQQSENINVGRSFRRLPDEVAEVWGSSKPASHEIPVPEQADNPGEAKDVDEGAIAYRIFVGLYRVPWVVGAEGDRRAAHGALPK